MPPATDVSLPRQHLPCKPDTVVIVLDQPLLTEGKLFEFEVAGDDGRFVSAHAWGQGDSIIVTSPVAARPRKVRYAWKDNPIRANVYQRDSLPMSPIMLNIVMSIPVP